MSDLTDWQRWRRSGREYEISQVTAILGRAPGGGSGALIAQLSTGERAFVKSVTSPQGSRVCLNEFIVGSCGLAIGGPVCRVLLVDVPHELAGDFNGVAVVAGVASASVEVPGVHERRDLAFRSSDDNRRRHAGVTALYLWCYGDDPQWLYDPSQDHTTYSHDHGHYFPSGPNWSTAALVTSAGALPGIPFSTDDLDASELRRLADVLRGVDGGLLQAILDRVPAAWPVTDEELAYLGWFLDVRRIGVADRLEELAT
jgi:hypothetical protein